ncbi:MAG: hypothetical protein ACOC6F_03935 [bacterium]
MDLFRELDGLAANISNPAFKHLAKSFEESLKQHRLAPQERAQIWQRYQQIWDDRKQWMSSRRQESEAAKSRYMKELYSLDFSYDGLPVFQGFSNWERVGEKVRSARERLRAMSKAIKDDQGLLPQDRWAIQQSINDYWDKTRQSEEATFSVHGERANQLYNEAYAAVENLRPRDAGPILKASRAELRSLWLQRGDREKYRSWFDDLWSKLQGKREEGHKRYRDWHARQEQGLEKLRAVRDGKLNALSRVRDNNSLNRERLSGARSSEHADRVSEWIREGEEKERDIERSIEEIESRIREAEDRLRR